MADGVEDGCGKELSPSASRAVVGNTRGDVIVETRQGTNMIQGVCRHRPRTLIASLRRTPSLHKGIYPCESGNSLCTKTEATRARVRRASRKGAHGCSFAPSRAASRAASSSSNEGRLPRRSRAARAPPALARRAARASSGSTGGARYSSPKVTCEGTLRGATRKALGGLAAFAQAWQRADAAAKGGPTYDANDAEV